MILAHRAETRPWTERKLESLFDLTGRVAIVTGGTRGIGRSVAEGFAAAGSKVVVASRKADACAETEAHLVGMGAEAMGVPTHLGELDDLAPLVARTVERFGRLDIVVNNAATALTMPLGALTPEAWAKSYDVNLRGPVFLVQEALPHLRESPCAAVVNVISAGAFLFSAPVAMYAGAKSALHVLHPLDGLGVRTRRHPSERARAREHRHRHDAGEHARGPGEHGRVEPPGACRASGRDGRPGALPGVRRRRAS